MSQSNRPPVLSVIATTAGTQENIGMTERQPDRAQGASPETQRLVKDPTSSAATPYPSPVSKPLYQQVKEHLIRRVLQGEWKPGECLPSEMKLAESYGLSQGTVRKAIEELAQDGLVSRHAGRGTFVTSHKGDYKPFRFNRFQSEMGERLTDERPQYVSCIKGLAPSRASKALQIAVSAEVIELVRLRQLEGQPILAERIVLGSELCPGFDRIIDIEKPNSIYLALEQHYNLLIVRVEERVRARLAGPDEQRLLNLDPGTPVLEVERIAYSLGDEPVEWRLSVCETGQVHYWNRSGG